MKPDKKMVGQKIKDIRLNKGLTLEDFGQKFNTNKVTVYNWEKGRNLPNKSNIKAIAVFAEISVNKLLYGEPKAYLNNLLWNSKSLDDFSDITFDKFFDNLKESVLTEDDLYLSEDEAVKRYKRFAELNKLDDYVDPLGFSIYSALENNKDSNLVKMFLTDADTNFSLLFGKSVKDAYDDYTND